MAATNLSNAGDNAHARSVMTRIANIFEAGEPLDEAQVICVFLHGRTHTIQEVQSAVLDHLDLSGVAVRVPLAQGASWYDMAAIEPLTLGSREQLAGALAALEIILKDLKAQAPGVPLVLAGFSQGACMALEHAFRGVESPSAVVAFTGCRVGTPDDKRPFNLPQNLPVYLSTGTDDPWLPLPAFAQTVGELGRAKAEVQAARFARTDHCVGAAEVGALQSVLNAVKSGRAPFEDAEKRIKKEEQLSAPSQSKHYQDGSKPHQYT